MTMRYVAAADFGLGRRVEQHLPVMLPDRQDDDTQVAPDLHVFQRSARRTRWALETRTCSMATFSPILPVVKSRK